MTLGSLTRALLEASHARLAREGAWVTNEKGLLTRAGFGDIGEMLNGTDSLVAILDRIESRIFAGD